MDQVRRSSEESFDRIHQVAHHLFHPLTIGIDVNSRNLDCAGLELDDEEHHVAGRAEWAQGFHAEEITRMQRVPVHFDERLPRPLLLPLSAGTIPSSAKMSATVVRPISMFNPVRSASRIFV